MQTTQKDRATHKKNPVNADSIVIKLKTVISNNRAVLSEEDILHLENALVEFEKVNSKKSLDFNSIPWKELGQAIVYLMKFFTDDFPTDDE
mgnify:CR=1 FL=1